MTLTLAEVADKCLNPELSVCSGIGLGLLALLLGLARWWLSLIPMAICLVANIVMVDDLMHVEIGHALLAEVGYTRVAMEHVAFDAPFLVLFVIGLFISRSIHRRCRRLEGLCPICRYDLRGHSEAVVLHCPECGWSDVKGVA